MFVKTNYSTFEIGKPSGCYSHLNSSVAHSSYFQIDKIYSFSNCSLISTTIPNISSCRNVAIAKINDILYNVVHENLIGVYLYGTNWVYISTFDLPNTF